MATLFISDLHLCPSRPHINRLFFDFLAGPAQQAEALYMLGDLFEYWAGDDDLDDPFNAGICAALQELSGSGVPVFFMAGNRDFLAGEGFAQAAGLSLLQEPVAIDLYGTATLLMHGDTLCTDDDAYQAFRAEVRSTEWQQAFLAMPLFRRKSQIEALRRESEIQKRIKPSQITDVSAAAVLQELTLHRCTRLIHGHTHRQARHDLVVEGQPCERWVLQDWYETGGYLSCDSSGCREIRLD
ncbi:MAG: UDP-2,3-diacylglucosamine diphosphatase [Betaproteobacteria bacterium]|jgi:UDP-2,3-diacylglucosamine hydrolase|nr:UDP-2,3-diacylglucosamine diphosphatase [Betaproteobacteria bacterium]